MTDHQVNLILASIILIVCVFVLIFPYIRFITHVWDQRREQVEADLQGTALIAYFKQFNKQVTEQDAAVAFKKLYQSNFGRIYYIWPMVAILILATLEVGALV